jgi:peptidoglycan/LPS O-acetylase OafA/YrhL
MGATKVATADDDEVATPPRFPRWMVRVAITIALAGVAWRHGVGQAPFGGDVTLNLLFDKWKLGPLRIINLLALLLLVVHYGPLLRRVMPRFRFLETLGAASLAVFVGHLVVALLALAYLGAASPERPLWIDIALFVGGFAILYLIAWITQQVDRRSAPARGPVGRWAAQGSRALISRRHSA